MLSINSWQPILWVNNCQKGPITIRLRYPVPGTVLAETRFVKMAGYPTNRNRISGTSLLRIAGYTIQSIITQLRVKFKLNCKSTVNCQPLSLSPVSIRIGEYGSSNNQVIQNNSAWPPHNMVSALFVPQTIRTTYRPFVPWTIRPIDLSYH